MCARRSASLRRWPVGTFVAAIAIQPLLAAAPALALRRLDEEIVRRQSLALVALGRERAVGGRDLEHARARHLGLLAAPKEQQLVLERFLGAAPHGDAGVEMHQVVEAALQLVAQDVMPGVGEAFRPEQVEHIILVRRDRITGREPQLLQHLPPHRLAGGARDRRADRAREHPQHDDEVDRPEHAQRHRQRQVPRPHAAPGEAGIGGVDPVGGGSRGPQGRQEQAIGRAIGQSGLGHRGQQP